MLKTMKALEDRAETAKHRMEEEITKLYRKFHECDDPDKRKRIRERLDQMIEEAERKKEESSAKQMKVK